jgi:hypothetical protein
MSRFTRRPTLYRESPLTRYYSKRRRALAGGLVGATDAGLAVLAQAILASPADIARRQAEVRAQNRRLEAEADMAAELAAKEKP